MTIKLTRAEYEEWRYKYSLMDPDYVVDILGVSSLELIDKFQDRFAYFIQEEFIPEVDDDEQELEDRGFIRNSIDEET
jgi:hypothetical protein